MTPRCLKAIAAIALAITLPVRAAEPMTSGIAGLLDSDPFSAEQLAREAGYRDDSELGHYLRGVALAGRLERARALEEFRAVYGRENAAPELAARSLAAAGSAALRDGHYSQAHELLQRVRTDFAAYIPESLLQDVIQTDEVAANLRLEPPQTVDPAGSQRFRLARNALGLYTLKVRIERLSKAAVLDTGANLSTLSASAAAELHVRMLDGQSDISSSTSGHVDTRFAVAETLRIGRTTLHHVVFLVLADAALSPAGPSSRIDVILGFPVLSALGRLSMQTDGSDQAPKRSLTISPSAHRDAGGNLRFDGFTPLVRAQVGDQALALMIDSGAGDTVLERRYARDFPERVRNLPRQTSKVGGAGGIEVRHEALLAPLTLGIGQRSVALTQVRVELDGQGNDQYYGTLGGDVLWSRGGYVIDFGALEFEIGPS